MIQIRYIEGNWEVAEGERTAYYSGPYAVENIHRCYNDVDELMNEARAHPVAFDCKELAPHFRRVIRFRNGSWERLMRDGDWISKSSLDAVRGCLIYHSLHLRHRDTQKMLDYLKANP